MAESAAFGFKGLDEIQRVFDLLPDKVQAKVHRSALRSAAQLWAKEARRRAPVRAANSLKVFSKYSRKARKRIAIGRLGGFLQREIRVRAMPQKKKGELIIKVGPSRDAFYGMFLEFGTRDINPRPFLRPAFDAKKAEILDKIGERMGKRVEAEAQKLVRLERSLGR